MMDRIRALVGSMQSDESRRLAERSREADAAVRQVELALLLGGLCFMALLAGYFLLVRRDFLGRSRAEAAVRESEERLRTTLHSIGDAVLATDSEGAASRS